MGDEWAGDSQQAEAREEATRADGVEERSGMNVQGRG